MAKRHTQGCGGKISYPTRSMAESAKRAMIAKDSSGQTNVFSCQECGGFHIGRSRRQGYASGTPDHHKDSFRNRAQRYRELTS